MVFKAKRARQLEFGPGDNPIEAFLSLRRKQASKKRRAASDIAQVLRERSAASPASAPAQPSAEPGCAPDATASSALAAGPVKDRQLRIARGFAR